MGYDYQVLVLGGGPGGYEAAIRSAQYGLKTALIEARELGGTCLNRGCIPTKALLHGAEVYQSALEARAIGITAENVRLDYAKLSAWKDQQVLKLRRGVEGLERAHGVTVVKGHGRLIDAHTLDVDGKKITAEKVILATGSNPSRPPIPGIENALTSDEVLAATALPKSLIIIGGGVIGIEFATLFGSLGIPVTVLEMMPDILPSVDAEILKILKGALSRKGVTLHANARVTAIHSDAVAYTLDGKETIAEAQSIVVCIGRRPATENIGLEALGIRTNRGAIEIDAHCETHVPGIYAVGDITGKIQLAHVASAQGLVAAANCAGKKSVMRYDIVPACVYTNPEIAYVGLSESAAQAAGKETRVGTFSVSGNGRALVMNQAEGIVKLVTDARTGEILGCQMIAPHATDMIAEIAAVMRCEGTIEELSQTIHPHPTVSEILMEAAHDAEGLCCQAVPKRKAI